MPERLVEFRGAVSCQRAPGVLGLTLSGAAAEPPGTSVALAFSAPAPAGLPATLTHAWVEALGGNEYRISSPPHSWLISAGAVHLHREIAADFYRAIPPRPVPLRRRMFWRLVVALAASRAGLAALRALRR